MNRRASNLRSTGWRWGLPAALVVGLGLWGLGGCVAPQGARVVSNPDLSQKIPAIRNAAQQRDIEAAPVLVADLESDDAAIRFYAIEGLRRITGQDFGYVYYNSEEQRRPALRRW